MHILEPGDLSGAAPAATLTAMGTCRLPTDDKRDTVGLAHCHLGSH